MKSTFLPAILSILLASIPLHADLFSGTSDFSNSSVDLEFTGAVTGSDTISVTQGNITLTLFGNGGVWETLTLTGGSFDVADASVNLTVAVPPSSDTLTTSGFGFSVLNSVHSLTPNGPDYTIGGSLSLMADQGSAALTTNGASHDYGANPFAVSPTLLPTSLLSIVDSDPNDGEISITGALRFGPEPIFDLGVASLSVSSVNTLNFGGTLAIPEPGTGGLTLLGLAFLLTLRRLQA